MVAEGRNGLRFVQDVGEKTGKIGWRESFGCDDFKEGAGSEGATMNRKEEEENKSL